MTVNVPVTPEKCHRTTSWNAELIHLMKGILFLSRRWWLWKGRLCYVTTWMSGKQCHSNYLFYVGMRASLGIWGPHWGLRRLCFYGAKISKVRIRPLNDSAQRNHHELKSHLFWRTLPNFFQGGTGSIRSTVTLGRASSSLVSTVC